MGLVPPLPPVTLSDRSLKQKTMPGWMIHLLFGTLFMMGIVICCMFGDLTVKLLMMNWSK